MPRQRRRWVPGTLVHLISRFVDREFRMVDARDRRHFLRLVEEASPRWDWEPVSYALMSNHVHWGVLAGDADPQSFFRSVHIRFAQHFHRRHGGIGPVLADRPRQHRVPRDLLARLVAYHHRNPVRAGVVRLPAQSRWTSHRAYLRLDPAPAWLNVERNLEWMGFCDTQAGRKQFDSFVTEVDLEGWHAIAAATTVAKHAATRDIVRLDEALWELLLRATERCTGVERAQLRSSRSWRASQARRLVCAVARERCAASYRDIGEHLGLSTARVHQLLTTITKHTSTSEFQRKRLEILTAIDGLLET